MPALHRRLLTFASSWRTHGYLVPVRAGSARDRQERSVCCRQQLRSLDASTRSELPDLLTAPLALRCINVQHTLCQRRAAREIYRWHAAWIGAAVHPETLAVENRACIGKKTEQMHSIEGYAREEYIYRFI